MFRLSWNCAYCEACLHDRVSAAAIRRDFIHSRTGLDKYSVFRVVGNIVNRFVNRFTWLYFITMTWLYKLSWICMCIYYISSVQLILYAQWDFDIIFQIYLVSGVFDISLDIFCSSFGNLKIWFLSITWPNFLLVLQCSTKRVPLSQKQRKEFYFGTENMKQHSFDSQMRTILKVP